MNEPSQALQTIDGQVLASEPGRPTMIRPLATPDEALEAWQAFEALKGKLITKDDIQHISDRDFIKKSGWRKIAAAFGISTECVAEEREGIPNGWLWRVRVRATAPNGRYAEGTAGCASNERRFSHPEHDVYAQAYTRACNRAVSDLVGGGQVSAEEMKADPAPPPTISRAQAEAVVDGFYDACQRESVPQVTPRELAIQLVITRGNLRQVYKAMKAHEEGAEPESVLESVDEPLDD